MDENVKYEVIKKLVETDGNKKRAAITLCCSIRHVNRMIKGYKSQGKRFFVHGNRDRKPAHTLSDEIKMTIKDLYCTKYNNEVNFTHFAELLKEHENINVSPSTINSILRQDFILSPKAKRVTKKAMKAELKVLADSAKSKKELAEIQSSILDIDEAHPRRPRSAYFGEQLQMDASLHLWFGDKKSQLHIAVDDATGAVVGAYFDAQETLNGYYNVLYQVLSEYGIPYQFLTDRRTVFEYKKKESHHVEDDTFTQFGYACKQLGIDIKTTSIAQAKGRVERMFGTLQSRLPVELRLAGVRTLEQANEFLKSYIKKFNAKFALPLYNITSVFETQPSNERILLTLAVLSSRKVDNGCCIKYQNKYYLPVDGNGLAVHYRKGTQGMVIKSFDNKLYFCVNESVYVLDVLKDHAETSKTFDLPALDEKPKKRYIPPMSHPWKQSSFEKYMQKQPHRYEVA